MGGVLWGSAVAIALVMAPLAPDSPVVAASADYSSFFTDPALAGAGWSTCAAPVTWSIDVRGLKTKVARREVQRVKEAWSAWSGASGVTFRYVGREWLVFNPVTNNLESEDGSIRRERHVYVAFKSRKQVDIMTETTVGLAMPSVVMLPTREIVGGMAIFRRGYVLEQRRVELRRVIQLYLHEFGHVMGLGHSPSPADVMFSQLDEHITLGAGDRSGIAAFTQPCAT
jgi:hypothetical protein